MVILNAKHLAQARLGKPYPLLSLKESLASLPPGEAFAIYRKELELPEGAVLRATKARSMQAAAKAEALVYKETGAAGELVVNKAPLVIGDSNHRDLVSKTRTNYLACFADARVWWHNHGIAWGSEVLLDFEDWELAQIVDRLELDPLIFRSNGADILYIDFPMALDSPRLRQAFMLTGCHSRAFGHWMWEYLPKFLSAVEAGLPAMPVLIDDDMPVTHEQALRQMMPEGFEIVKVKGMGSVQVNELWCAPTLFYMPQLEIMNVDYRWDILAGPVDRFLPVLRRMAGAFAGNDSQTPHEGRVFLARRKEQRRKMVNHVEIEELARRRGFIIAYADALSFAEQAALIRSARHVVAPEGSAAFLMFLARSGSKLLILNHPDTEGQPSFTALIEAAGIETLILTGPYARRDEEWPHFSDYSIEAYQFARVLDTWLVTS